MVGGGSTHATWPLNEDYCRSMLLLHWPNWFDIEEVKENAESWIDCFREFLSSTDCPAFTRAQVEKAKLLVGHPQEPVFHEEEEDIPVEAEEQPDWVDFYAGQNQRHEGVERDFDYDECGDDYDWTSTSINIPQGKDPKTWFQDAVRVTLLEVVLCTVS